MASNTVSMSRDSMGYRFYEWIRTNDKKYEELIDYSQSLIRLNSFESVMGRLCRTW